MKAKWILIALVVILLLSVIVAFAAPHHYEPIVLIQGVKFGMSPSEVQSIFGRADSEKESTLSPELDLSYESTYGGLPAEYHFRFVRVMLHYELYEAGITCRTNSESEREMISATVLEQLKDAYGKLDGYYEEVTEEESRVGVSRGAVQISAVVETDSSVVHAQLSRIY